MTNKSQTAVENLYDLFNEIDSIKIRKFVENFYIDKKYGKEPYTYHLDKTRENALRLNNKFSHLNLDYKILEQIALLHDILEDSYELNNFLDIRKNVCDMVGAYTFYKINLISKYKNQSYDDYIDYIIKTKDPYVLIVKLADSLHNLESSILSFKTNKIKKYSNNVNKILEALEEIK